AYFAAKKNGRKIAKKKIALVIEKLNITTVDDDCCRNAISNKQIDDLEDGLEYYSALLSKCTTIITYDKKDFHFSELEVMDAEEYLLKAVVQKGP
nr:twitching motility protein PilT [Bacteroidota bacterium]